MNYLQAYKDSLCYEPQGMLPERNENFDPDFEEDGLTLSAAQIWPRHKSGPDKGKIKPVRDNRKKIVVDPAGNINR